MIDIKENLGKTIFDNLKISGTPEKLMGAKVTFSKSLVRIKKYLNTKEMVWISKKHLTLQHGIIIGARHLNVGKIEGNLWGEVTLTPCILIATSPFQKPTFIPLSGIVSVQLRQLNDKKKD